MGSNWSSRSAFLASDTSVANGWRLSGTTDLSDIIAEGRGGDIDPKLLSTWGDFQYAESWGKDATPGHFTFAHLPLPGSTLIFCGRIDFFDDKNNHVAIWNGGLVSPFSFNSGSGIFFAGKWPANVLPVKCQPKEITDEEIKKWVEDCKAHALAAVPAENRKDITPESIAEFEKEALKQAENIKARLGKSPSFQECLFS